MKSIKDVSNSVFPIQEVGEEACEKCGFLYKLYKTSRGVIGACKPCTDNELLKTLNLPTVEDYNEEKPLNFILSFEKVSEDLKNASVQSYKPKHDSQIKAKQMAIKFVKEFDGEQSLTFSGTPGLGKSHLGYAINKAVRSKGYKSLFIKVTDLLRDIRNTFDNKKITEEQIFTMIEGLDLLVLDDIGSEYVKSNEAGHETWSSDILYKIFDMRLGRSTICTTNYSEGDLELKYGNNGPRIISRMMNNSKGIRLQGEDYRRQGGLENV